LNYSDGQSGDSSSSSESEERKAAEAAEKALVAAKKEEERKKKQDHWTNMVAHVAAVECISISLKSLLLRTHVQSCAHRQTPRHTHTHELHDVVFCSQMSCLNRAFWQRFIWVLNTVTAQSEGRV